MSEKKLSQENEDYINKKMIYCALLLQEYAYRELINSSLTVRDEKHYCKIKFNAIRNQILQLERISKSTKEQLIHSEDLAMDNVSLMASIVGTLAIVPGSQVDFIEKEFAKICVTAIKNYTDEHERKSTTTSS
tara:strand:- start:57 stop:455 length:399 start_codon:yes stop_codon:yes gene_type:complete